MEYSITLYLPNLFFCCHVFQRQARLRSVAPVSPEETLEIISFMDAAQRSKAAAGQPMRLR
jgi:hypothetical protein